MFYMFLTDVSMVVVLLSSAVGSKLDTANGSVCGSAVGSADGSEGRFDGRF